MVDSFAVFRSIGNPIRHNLSGFLPYLRVGRTRKEK